MVTCGIHGLESSPWRHVGFMVWNPVHGDMWDSWLDSLVWNPVHGDMWDSWFGIQSMVTFGIN